MTRSTISLSLAAATIVAAAAPAVAEAGARCPAAAKRIASNTLVRIYQAPAGAVRACWRSSGRTVQLTSRGQTFRLGELGGRHVAYSVFDNDTYTYLAVERMDVRARRLTVSVAATSYQAGGAEGGGGARVDEVRLARSGVAWTAWNPRLPGRPWEVGYVPAGTLRRDARIVGSSPTLEPGSLAIGRRYLYWSTADGAPQRARY